MDRFPWLSIVTSFSRFSTKNQWHHLCFVIHVILPSCHISSDLGCSSLICLSSSNLPFLLWEKENLGRVYQSLRPKGKLIDCQNVSSERKLVRLKDVQKTLTFSPTQWEGEKRMGSQSIGPLFSYFPNTRKIQPTSASLTRKISEEDSWRQSAKEIKSRHKRSRFPFTLH